MRRLAATLALVLALFTSSCVLPAPRMAAAQRVEQALPSEPPAFRTGRFFEEMSFPGVILRLMFNIPGYVTMVEVDPITGEAESGLLRTWVQHCPPAGCVYPESAYAADVIISCFPSGQPPEIRWRHVLPYHAGAVWIYQVTSARIYVSADEEPMYTFLVRNGSMRLRVEE